ncbi:MAG: hypothetical protein Q4B42_00835 [Oscillospiraceae bacterium]|nr:hypothetical protein [Oscillospiraceae bacterium]
MQKIIFVSHCVLNTASKVVMYNEEEMAAEETLRRRFLKRAVEKGVQLVQLPCPEFLLYGRRRWGHVSEQFDTPYFRAECRRMLREIILQLKEYLAGNDRFEVLGIVGIDGSPSCGVDYTCFGDWGGNLGDRQDLEAVIASSRLGEGSGILIEELKALLAEEGIELPLRGLFAPEPEKLMSLLD